MRIFAPLVALLLVLGCHLFVLTARSSAGDRVIFAIGEFVLLVVFAVRAHEHVAKTEARLRTLEKSRRP